MSDIEIQEHEPGTFLKPFIGFAHEIYRDDPAWVAPLEMELKERLSPKKNPFFQHAEARLFTAWRDGKMVGRCSAQVDHEHLRVHEDGAGFFGFFDTIEDQEVANALLGAAGRWLADKGMRVMRGPFSLSINEESGVLVEGFEHPPVMLMPHSRPYQSKLIEQAGLESVKELYSWRYHVEPPPPRAEKAWQAISELPEVQFRSLDKGKMRQEVATLLEIFNEAWHKNWGFVPATEAEADKMAQDLKLILDDRLTFFAEIEGRAVGICLCAPNLNEVIHDFNGKLNPVTVTKLLWRLKVKHPKSARLILLGIRPELAGQKRYNRLGLAMYAEIAKRGIKHDYSWAELGWTLEENLAVNMGIKTMRGKIYKRYRIYERPVPQR